MDDGLYVPGLLFVILGIGGVWLAFFSGIADTFRALGEVAVLMLVLGLIVVVVSVVRGGASVRVPHILSMALVVVLGISMVGMPYYFTILETTQQPVGREVVITLISREWAFNNTNPVFKVYVGDLVRIVLINEGEIVHNIGLPDFRVSGEWILTGERTEVVFYADRPGEFDYLCEVPGHAELGMRGKFVIEPRPEGEVSE